MRFNPPPYWPPVPPGWTPPPGWQPDPAWPPPPPGWHVWVDEPPALRRKPLLIGGGIAVTLLVLAGVMIAVVTTRNTPDVSAAGRSTNSSANSVAKNAAGSDEEQIKLAVKNFQDAWNNADLTAFEPLFCARLRKHDSGPSDNGDPNTKVLGSERLELSVQSTDITGDNARVTIHADGGGTRIVPFVRERGAWKWCPEE